MTITLPTELPADAPIVTRVDANSGFFPAEDYHQDFLVRHPNYPYIVFNDLPKVANLKRMFPQAYLEKPVLVLAAQPIGDTGA